MRYGIKLMDTNNNLFRSVKDFFSNSFNFSGYINNKKPVLPYWKLVGLSFILLSLPFTTYYLVKFVKFMNGADASQFQPVIVSISSDTNNLPSDQLIHVNMNAQTNELVFAKVVLSFDPTKIQLSSTPSINPTFANIVQNTDLQLANTTGKWSVAAAVKPGVNSPSGQINDFATFNLTSISLSPNDSTTVSFVTSEMQLVDEVKLSAVPISDNSMTFTLNFTATPSPSPTPSPTASPSPSPTASPSPSPTPSPTLPPLPTRSPSPSPVPIDTQAPSVNITFPTQGAIIPRNTSITLQANANDNVGVSKVDFIINGKVRCTDSTTPYSCVWAIPNSPNTLYTIQAKAYDARNNTAINQITATSSN